MDLRAMECDSSSAGRTVCAIEGLLVGSRRPSRKSLENFGSLPRTPSPTAVCACADEVEEIGDDQKSAPLKTKRDRLIARNPDLFAAAVLLCGIGGVEDAPKIRQIPISAFHGA